MVTPQHSARNMHDNKSISVISYPKTGNKWLQFIIGRYLQNLTSSADIILPDGSKRANATLTSIGFPPIAHWTHAPLVWKDQAAEDLAYENVVGPFASSKVVLLARHPLDTLLSAFFHNNYQKGKEYRYIFPSFESFVRDPVFGLNKLTRFYTIWADSMRQTDVFVVRYEDLHIRCEETISSLFAFCGFSSDLPAIQDAIRFSSFENMQQIEKSRPDLKYESSGLYVFGTGEGEDVKAMHVRFGIVGNYRNYLSLEAATTFEDEMSRNFPRIYGYHEPLAVS